MTAKNNSIALNREFDSDSYGENMDSINTAFETLMVSQNFNGQIIENIRLPAGENVRISHNLKTVPKYRIILRQQGDLVITDGDFGWTDKYIYLKANSLSENAFQKDIMLQGTSTFGGDARIPANTVCGTGDWNPNYVTTGGSDVQIIEKECLNDALSSNSTGQEATISILLLRG